MPPGSHWRAVRPCKRSAVLCHEARSIAKQLMVSSPSRHEQDPGRSSSARQRSRRGNSHSSSRRRCDQLRRWHFFKNIVAHAHAPFIDRGCNACLLVENWAGKDLAVRGDGFHDQIIVARSGRILSNRSMSPFSGLIICLLWLAPRPAAIQPVSKYGSPVSSGKPPLKAFPHRRSTP